MNYQPPFILTAKILSLVEDITRLVTQLTLNNPQPIPPLLRKENQIKTLAIEGNMLGEEKITAVLAPFIAFILGVILQALKNVPKDVPENVPEDASGNAASQRQLKLLARLKIDNKITIKALAKLLNSNEKTIKRDLDLLKNNHKIKRIGSARAGHWELIE